MAGLEDITLGNWSQIAYAPVPTDASDPVYGDPVANVQTLTHPTDERNIVEVPQYGQDYPRKLVGSSTTGNCEVVVNYKPDDPTHIEMLRLYSAKEQQWFKISVFESDANDAPSQEMEFLGRVASRSSSGEFDAVTTITFSIAVDGQLGEWAAAADAP